MSDSSTKIETRNNLRLTFELGLAVSTPERVPVNFSQVAGIFSGLETLIVVGGLGQDESTVASLQSTVRLHFEVEKLRYGSPLMMLISYSGAASAAAAGLLRLFTAFQKARRDKAYTDSYVYISTLLQQYQPPPQPTSEKPKRGRRRSVAVQAKAGVLDVHAVAQAASVLRMLTSVEKDVSNEN